MASNQKAKGAQREGKEAFTVFLEMKGDSVRDKASKYRQVFSQIKHLSNVLGQLQTHRKAHKEQFISGTNKSQNILAQNLAVLLANGRPRKARKDLTSSPSAAQPFPVLCSVEAILGAGDSPELWD